MKFINSCDGIYDSLDVRLTKKCDNKCAFCIERNGLKGKPTNVKEIINTINKHNPDDILLLGGEPLLMLDDVVEIVGSVNKPIYLTTSLPTSTLDSRIDYIIDKLAGLNISLHSIDWKENNAILGATSQHNRVKTLERLLKKHSDKIRVCINLVKGGIDTKEKLENTLITLSKMGVQKVKINELQHEPRLYVSIEKILDLKLPSPYSNGCNTNHIMFGMDVLIKRSCFIVEESLKPSLKDLLKVVVKMFHKPKGRFAVCYEDGTLSNSWKGGQNA